MLELTNTNKWEPWLDLISIALAGGHVLLRNELITEILSENKETSETARDITKIPRQDLIADNKDSTNFAEQEDNEAEKPNDAAGLSNRQEILCSKRNSLH